MVPSIVRHPWIDPVDCARITRKRSVSGSRIAGACKLHEFCDMAGQGQKQNQQVDTLGSHAGPHAGPQAKKKKGLFIGIYKYFYIYNIFLFVKNITKIEKSKNKDREAPGGAPPPLTPPREISIKKIEKKNPEKSIIWGPIRGPWGPEKP